MYKLVAIDLDGTLLTSTGEVTENTRIALKKAKEQGVEVVLSSGRPISSTESLAVELGVDNYLISGNGAAVFDVKEQKIIYDRFLTKEQVLKIAKLCEENSFFYNVYTEEEVIEIVRNTLEEGGMVWTLDYFSPEAIEEWGPDLGMSWGMDWVPMDDPQTYASSLLEGFQYQGFDLYYIEYLYTENGKVVLKTYFGDIPNN